MKCEKCNFPIKPKWWQPVWWKCICDKYTKVSDLQKLSLSELDNDDVFFLISDVSEKVSKKITVGDLIKYISGKI